jgi:hypothetical protein
MLRASVTQIGSSRAVRTSAVTSTAELMVRQVSTGCAVILTTESRVLYAAVTCVIDVTEACW